MLSHFGVGGIQLSELVMQDIEPFRRQLVGLFFERDLFDLQLQDAPLHDVDFGGQRIDLDTQL